MIARNIHVGKLQDLYIEGVPISSIAIILDVAESEIHYAIEQLRKKNPEDWPKRGKGFVKPSNEKPPAEPPKEKVEIKSSFTRILPPVEKVNSEVVTRQMTPEELARINSIGKQTTTSTGSKIQKVFHYSDKPKNKPIEEAIPMKPEDLTKEIYLKLKEEGRKNAQIERDYNMRPNHIYIVLKTWGIAPASKIQQSEDPRGLIALNESKGIIIKPGVNGADAIEKDQPVLEVVQEQTKAGGVDSKSDESAIQEIIPESSTSAAPARKYLTLQIPLIDVGANRFDQRLKMVEEAKEFATEIELKDVDYPRTVGELFDAIQTLAGLIRAELQDLIVDENVTEKVEKFFQHHNNLHVQKIDRYAAERGWKVSGL